MVFISYSSKDWEQADCVRNILEKNEIVCWMAPESIPDGSSYLKEIPKAIENCEVLLVLISSDSQDSDWVKSEIDNAKRKKKYIYPIHIDESVINQDFEFLFGICQIKNAYGKIDKAIEEIVPTIKEKEKYTADVSLETSFSMKKDKKNGDGSILIRARKEAAKYDFSENNWKEFTDYVSEIVSILHMTEKKNVIVRTDERLGECECAPMDNQPYWNGPGRLKFTIRDIGENREKDFTSFYFVLNRNKVELKLYFSGEISEKKSLEEFGINEERFLEVLTSFIEFMSNLKDVNISNKIRYVRTTNTSVEYELLFG